MTSTIKSPQKRPEPLTNSLMLGARLRALRRLKGFTVEDLANAVSVDKAHISRIENNLKTPSIATLAQMASALGVSIGRLLGETLDPSEIKVSRANQLTDLAEAHEPALHHFVPLLHGKGVHAFETFLVYPGLEAGEAQAQHGGQEMLYVLSGVVDVMFQNHTVHITKGDCIHFPGYLQHRMCRVGRAKAMVLLVLANE